MCVCVCVCVRGIIFLNKAHLECRRQRVLSGNKAHSKCRRQQVLSRIKAHLDVCVDKRRYNRNWCTSGSLGIQLWHWKIH